ncbi:hypothetical protein [Flaviaesturariibacter amylovorans]|uniref:Lipoprotein n=1 Tax=Flaviaesturariibacter amylovorans TaxID=1084520 RepID=A0ABP8H311_9BACT
MKIFWSVLVAGILIASCKKEPQQVNCSRLSQGIRQDDATQVAASVEAVLVGLPDRQYTAANLALLAERLSTRCSIEVRVRCFDCIKTLPSMSELHVTTRGSAPVSKVLDISYTDENKMEFRAMHD